MIGYESPDWFIVDGFMFACYSITDEPGGQYVYRNRSEEWTREFLELVKSRRFYSRIGGSGSPERLGKPLSLENLADWWYREIIGCKYSRQFGAVITINSNRGECELAYRTTILIHGLDHSPERQWECNPIRKSLSAPPMKRKCQRKIEANDPKKRKIKYDSYCWKSNINFGSELFYQIGESRYDSRKFSNDDINRYRTLGSDEKLKLIDQFAQNSMS